ncbi:MerR family transcriptional regulator [[Clostridium] dakarense]|uniref:MerR family transcriptional regulator n=1 Tax=Faecalimicrobium dakarense TaxID=1301100 RepID=UPI0004B9AA27|nr:MerR family transcriptional regulator [[Clostridium] dakarense]
MFPIGIFSKINKVTTKTLRYYEDIGLLKPEYVDESTKYRYYTTEQLPKLHKIITLKQMGLSLNEIKEAIDNPEKVEEIIKSKEIEVLNAIKKEEYKLLKLRSYLSNLKGEDNMKNIIIKSLPEVKVASMRKVIKSHDELFHLCPNIMAKEMERLGCVCASPSYCFNIYHDGEYKETNIDVEICESIVSLKEDSEILAFKIINEVEKAVCILHKGPYSSLGESYSYAFKWIKENKYKLIGNPRESYIDGIWNKEDEKDWLTEIQIPVEANL